MASYNVKKQNIFVKGEKRFPMRWRNGNQPLTLLKGLFLLVTFFFQQQEKVSQSLETPLDD